MRAMWTSYIKTAITIVVITYLMILITFDNFSHSNQNIFKRIESPPIVTETGEGRNRTGILFDTCVLDETDPWDALINSHIHYGFDPFKNCTPKIKMATMLEDGKLYVLDNRPNVECSWRCLLPKSDYTLTYGPLQKLVNGSVPECDVIETKCRKNRVLYYEFLHAQVYRNTTSENEEKFQQSKKPDVHIIVFDSVSQSQFIRSMPKTQHYLREYYEAISFRYLNKIADNSMPNGMAFLLGKTMLPIPKSPMSVGYDADYHNGYHCHKARNNDQFIAFQYREANYTTLMSEDWAQGVFNFPECVGFKEKPVDHYMRPFQLRVEGKQQTPLLKSSIYNGVCRDAYVPQIEYLQDLLDKYPDKPKFTLTWMSYVAHDDINGLFHADDYFYNFFKDNVVKLNNSYVFIMGDHGMRFGTVRQTTVGERENNNPFLFMTLPGSMRDDNELMSVVRHNAHQLISHYDLYATFADIVAPYRPNNSSKPIIRGSSVLKPLPQPRTCDRLRIPFEYCICDYKKTEMPVDAALGHEAATLMVAKMNNVVKHDNLMSSLCVPLTVNKTAVTSEQIHYENSFAVYRINFKVLPGNGQFWGYVGQNVTSAELQLLSDKFLRVDSYAKTAFCAKKSANAAYCFCKSLLEQQDQTDF